MNKYILSIIFISIFSLVACSNSFQEGSYTGRGKGYNEDGIIEVQVIVDSEGQISSIEASHQDTPEIADPAIDQLSSDMIEENTYKVDRIAGASYTSRGFIEAVEDALTAE